MTKEGRRDSLLSIHVTDTPDCTNHSEFSATIQLEASVGSLVTLVDVYHQPLLMVMSGPMIHWGVNPLSSPNVYLNKKCPLREERCQYGSPSPSLPT